MGPALDPLLEPLLSHCLSMAGQTKKLVATASQSAATSLITNSAYHLKTIQLLWTGMNDKIVLARTFISAHLNTFIKIHGAKKSFALVDSSGGVDLLELCIKKGLVDPNPIVKENIRAAFWASSEIWPKMTERILVGLDGATRKALDKAAPGKAVLGGVGAVVGGGGGAKVARPSMRELMAAKAAATAAAATVKSDKPIASSSAVPTESPATPPKKPAGFRPIPPRAITSPQNGSSRLTLASSPRSSARAASPRSPRTSVRTPPPKSHIVNADSNDLMSSTSPFRLDEQDDSAFDFDALPPPIAPNSRIRQLSIPVEPVVEDALRDQADQAEQAAERLLEISDDQEPPKVVAVAVAVAGGEEREVMGTPVRNVGLMRGREDVFADSPEVRNGAGGGGLAGRKNWWMKKSSSTFHLLRTNSYGTDAICCSGANANNHVLRLDRAKSPTRFSPPDAQGWKDRPRRSAATVRHLESTSNPPGRRRIGRGKSYSVEWRFGADDQGVLGWREAVRRAVGGAARALAEGTAGALSLFFVLDDLLTN